MPTPRDEEAATQRGSWAAAAHLARAEDEDTAQLLWPEEQRRGPRDGPTSGAWHGRGGASAARGDGYVRAQDAAIDDEPYAGLNVELPALGMRDGRKEESQPRILHRDYDPEEIDELRDDCGDDHDHDHDDDEEDILTSDLRAKKFSLFRRCGLVVFALALGMVILVLRPGGSGGDDDGLSPVPKLDSDSESDDGAQRFFYDIVSDPISRPMEGTNEVIFGPFKVEENLFAESFTPLVDMDKVHHMIVYKSMTATAESPKQNLFWSIVTGKQNPQAMVVYAWARTGQETPLTFRAVSGSGAYLGPGTDAPYLYFDVHYELSADAVQDRENTKAGIRMVVKRLSPNVVSQWQDCQESVNLCPTEQGLGVSLVHNSSFELPPRRNDVDVAAMCAVTQDGILYAYRNHGHDEGRQWVTELFRDGTYVGKIVDRSVSDPQIFYEFPEGGIPVREGDVLKLHCHFQTSSATWVTTPGPSLKRHQEMCNQYLMYYPHYPSGNEKPGICAQRGSLKSFSPATYVEAPFDVDAQNELPMASSLGEVTAMAVSPDGRTVYMLARRSNSFFSDDVIPEDTIFVMQRTSGHVLRSFGNNLFVTPHGLFCDDMGKLWVTDTHLHLVFELDAKTGEVLQTIGTRGQSDVNESSFNAPTDVAVDSERGEVFVADGYGHSRVAVFNYSSGMFLRSWGETTGSEQGEFRVVHSVAFDASRDWVYVADRDNCRVQIFTRLGKLVKIWPSAGYCRKVEHPDMENAFAGHLSAVAYSQRLDLVFALEAHAVVLRRPLTDEIVATIDAGSQGRQMQWPHDIDVGLNAVKPSIYVAELTGNRTTRFSVGDGL
ncbi:Peptidyl-glycine alpha-amidating monooxygenase [Hondaea fermentalgiana]|uniref:peptidylamidoglycolate lyase n=1 Tax=Hondaea fermentalgiana TaxID=2315210 RepID=A0A2R5GEY0_9STRA|nr:Peptidyl-glycine alpha-amidating monooxygenase [Hondaea fermentalgiana]|eukprot:GBG28879.1 Peptidyl-glycine alpha-amidating monooxygenase [Hondaea fermentalgiana]